MPKEQKIVRTLQLQSCTEAKNKMFAEWGCVHRVIKNSKEMIVELYTNY